MYDCAQPVRSDRNTERDLLNASAFAGIPSLPSEGEPNRQRPWILRLPTKQLLLAVVGWLAILAALPVHADESNWAIAGSGDWQNTSSWNGGVPGAGDTATFDPFPSSLASITISSPATIGTVNFGQPAFLYVSGQSLTFDTQNPLEEAEWNIYPAAYVLMFSDLVLTSDLRVNSSPGTGMSLFLEGDILGSSGNFTAAGGGVIKFKGDNSLWSGELIVDGARVDIESATALGDSGVGAVVNSGGLWFYDPTSDAIQLNGGELAFVQDTYSNAVSASGGQIINYSSNVASSLALSGDVLFSGDDAIFSGGTTGSGNLTLEHLGDGLSVTGQLLHTGQTRLIGAVEFDTSTSSLANSDLYLEAGSDPTGELRLVGSGPQSLLTGTIYMQGGSMTRDAAVPAGVGIDMAGMVFDSGTIEVSLHGSGGITKQTSSTLVLDQNNSYAGQTIINQGTVVVAHPNGLGAASGTDADATIVNAGGKLSFGELSTLPGEKLIINGGTLEVADHETNGNYSTTHFTGPIEVTGNTVFNADSQWPRIDSGISGSGSIRVTGGGGYYFNADNSYTGETIVQGYLEVSTPQGLGDSSAGTLVQGGYLTVGGGGGSEAIVVEANSTLSFARQAIPYTHTVTSRGGTITTGSGPSQVKLATTLQVEGGSRLGIGFGPTAYLDLEEGISGNGSLLADNHVGTLWGSIDVQGNFFSQNHTETTFKALLNLAGDIRIGGGLFTFANDGQSFMHLVTADGRDSASRINVDANYTLGKVVVDPRATARANWHDNFWLRVADGKQVTIAESLEFYGGVLSGSILGQTTLVKHIGTDAYLENISGSAFESIVVEGDQLSISGNVNPALTSIVLPTGARASLYFYNSSYAGDIYLNNTREWRVLWTAGNSVLSGNIYLGDQGSTIGSSVISGQIHGGDLYAHYSGLSIRSDGHTYTGETSVSQGSLELIDNSRLASTSAISLNRATLNLDNRGTVALSDRIDDSLSIELLNSSLNLYGRAGESVSETIGSLTASGGQAILMVSSDSLAGSQTTLLLNSFQRTPGSNVTFDVSGSGSKILFASAPSLDEGLLGGWAAYGLHNFASYGANGVSAYSSLYTESTDINATSSSQVVRMNNDQTLASSQEIKALILASNSDLDLDGNTLTVGSGGILNSASISQINNGAITSGGNELFVLFPGNHITEIRASITDGPAGSVSLVVGQGDTRLSGLNTYSGATIANRATITAQSADTLPLGTDVQLNGGNLYFNYDTAYDGNGDPIPASLGNVVINGDGRISWNTTTDQGAIEATAYHVEDGSILLEIVGEGTLTKTGAGTFLLDAPNPRWSGAIDIQEGTLHAYYPEGLGNAPLDDAHAITIRRGATLELDSDIGGRRAILDGGEILLNPGDSFLGPVEIRSSSTLRGERISFIQGEISGDGDLEVVGTTFVSDGNAEAVSLNGSLNNYAGDLLFTGGFSRVNSSNPGYSGNVTVAGRRLSLGSGSSLGSAQVTVVEGGALHVPGSLQTSVHLEGGTLEFAGSSGSLAGPLTVSDKSYVLIGDNYSAGEAKIDGPLTLNESASLHITMNYHPDDRNNLAIGRQALIRNDLHVAGSGQILSFDSPVNISGTLIAEAADSNLHLDGSATYQINTSIEVAAGRELTVLHDGTPLDQLVLNGSNKELRGGGIVHADILLLNGAAASPGASAGLLTVDGDLQFNSNARFNVEIGGTQYDRIAATGSAQVGGTIHLSLINDYSPILGDTFQVLTAAARSGDFHVATGVVQGPYGLAVVYHPQDVTVRVSLRGDTDLDDDVDTSDISTAFQHFNGSGGTGNTWADGDYDGDGDVDTADLTVAFQHFTGAMSGLTGNPDLIYDPTTGNVRIVADGASIGAFNLQITGQFTMLADFSDLSADTALPSGPTDNTPSAIGWISSGSLFGVGFDGPLGAVDTAYADLGNILPTGLDLAGLQTLLTNNQWAGPLGGSSGGSFDLVVQQVPEPTSWLLLLLGLASLGLWRKRQAAA